MRAAPATSPSGGQHGLPPRRRRWPIVAGSVVAFTAAAAIFSQIAFAATLFSDNFEDGNTSGWSKSGGTWAVVSDGSSAVRQSNAGSENARDFAGTAGWTNYTVTARVKPLSVTSNGL